MPNYRRLISYIYAYEGGVKGRNIGFAKIESRGVQCKITVNVKKVYVGSNDTGVYLLSGDREIFLGNIFIRGGSGEFRTVVSMGDVEYSGISMDDCFGLTVHDVENTWRTYTTIWEDAVAHAAEVELAEAASESSKKTETEQLVPLEKVKEAVHEIEEEFPIEPTESVETVESEKPASPIRPIYIPAVEYAQELVPDTEAMKPDLMIEHSDMPQMAGQDGWEAQKDSSSRRNQQSVYQEPAQTLHGQTARQAVILGETVCYRADSFMNVPRQESDSYYSGYAGMEAQPYPAKEAMGNAAETVSESAPESASEKTPESAPESAPETIMEIAAEQKNAEQKNAEQKNTDNEAANLAAENQSAMENLWNKQETNPLRREGDTRSLHNQTVSTPVQAEFAPEASAPEQNTMSAPASEPPTPFPPPTPASQPSAPEASTPEQSTPPPAAPLPSHARTWEKLKQEHTKIMDFDYEKGCEILTVKPQDIGVLPRENWTYGNNSFLLHGYYNFRYLILARLANPGGMPRYLLGVPGHYYSNERYMAAMFGFQNFVLSKNQPVQDGRFGYWYTDISLEDDEAEEA